MNDASPEAIIRGLDGRTTRPPRMFGRLAVLSIDDILNAPPRSYILKGLMAPAETSLWWGPPKCGKSFLMLHIAYAIARGASVFGRRVRGCPVLYVAAEGEAGLATRLRALRDAWGDAPRFHLIAQPADLLHADGDLDHVESAARHLKVKLIVIDTLSRVLAGGDENSPGDMGGFVMNIGRLRHDTGAHVAVVHHGTKNPNGSTPRGHTSLVGAADLVVEVAKVDGGARLATVTAAKDDPEGGAMAFGLRLVEMGLDEDDDPITTCVVDEQAEASARKQEPSPTERAARRFLADLIASEGEPLPAGAGYPVGLRGARESRWRQECESRRLSTAETKDSRSKAFRRAYDGLLKASVVAARDGWVWLAEAPGGFPS